MRLWKFLSARAIAAALTESGYPVSEDVVQRWKKAQKPDPRAVDKLAEVLGIHLDAEEQPPEPAWVERLLAGVMALESKSELTDAELAQAQARAAIYLAANTRRRPRQGGGGGAAGSSS